MENIDGFLTEIKGFLRSEQITRKAEDLQFYAQDWSKVLTPNSSAILFPESTEETSKIVKSALKHSVSIIPSGGRTGLSGGAVATKGEVILSTLRMNSIGPLHEGALTLHVGAGAITEAVHQFCDPFGLTWPVDFASKGSSTVGGNIATNAGGVRVIRYGNTRNWILGLTVVTMNGEILKLNQELEKNNTGYDFRQLMIGSEGTLGIITEASLKLCPRPHSTLVFFLSLESFESLLALFQFSRKRFQNISAFECLDERSLNCVATHFQKPLPVQTRGKVYALMELENTEFTDAEKGLEEIFERGLVLDGIMAQNESQKKELWQYREGVAESIINGNWVHQEDVSVPVAHLKDFYSEIESRYAEAFPHFEVFFFGHIGDGNLHIFIRKPPQMSLEQFQLEAKASDLELFQILRRFKGSVSAEHGIGLLKKHAIHFSRSAEELRLMGDVKRAFDPRGLLNPGKIFDQESTNSSRLLSKSTRAV